MPHSHEHLLAEGVEGDLCLDVALFALDQLLNGDLVVLEQLDETDLGT